MSLQTLMNTTVTTLTVSQTKQGPGFNSPPVLTAALTNVPARVTKQDENKAVLLYGKYDAEVMKRIYFNSDPQLTPAKSWIQWQGVNYAVTSIQNNGGNISKLWTADVIQKPFN